MLESDGLYMEDGEVNIKIDIPRISANTTFISSVMGEELTGSLSMELSAPPENIRLTLHVETIFLDLINEYLNKDNMVKNKILNAMNQALEKNRARISDAT